VKTLARSISAYGSDALAAWRALPHPERVRLRNWAIWIAVVTVAFAQPLFRLMVHASEQSLHSHILLVPFVAAYMLFTSGSALPAAGRGSIAGAALAFGAGLGALAARIALDGSLTVNDGLALTTLAYLGIAAAGGFLFVGVRWMAAAAFPLAFLLFMVPLPDAAVIWLEDALVVASADVSAWMIAATGTPLLREGTVFTLPTIVLEVARECSGIRSTGVLFITSVVASQMFLTSPWRRLVLVAFVIPLGILRNGFRILTIALLCVKVGPHMVDSVIHHRGGPIFFALSLVPLFLLLTWLRRSERATTRDEAGPVPI
jgi:exosortase C (VPDSG-CTERM-specific)